MTATAHPSTTQSRSQMRRVAIATSIGTTIEFYDFLIYGLAAALVFPVVFFPDMPPAVATIASFSTLAVAFIARPLGAILFGHFGDRIGRKATLITTLMLMGGATIAMGFIPPAAVLGPLAPILLVILRFAQGLALGGEWAGAALLAAENAPKEKRGFYGVFPQLGPAIGYFLSAGAFIVTLKLTSQEAFMSWGWRVPFVASIVLVAVGLYVRVTLGETAAFKHVQQAKKSAPQIAPRRAPMLEAFRKQPREIALSGGVMMLAFGFFYLGTSYLSSYGQDEVGGMGLSFEQVFGVGMFSAAILALVTLFSGRLCDRIGRRKVIMIGSLVGTIWGFVIFPVLNFGGLSAFALAQVMTLVVFGIAYAPAGSFIPELFDAEHRYTGAGGWLQHRWRDWRRCRTDPGLLAWPDVRSRFGRPAAIAVCTDLADLRELPARDPR